MPLQAASKSWDRPLHHNHATTFAIYLLATKEKIRIAIDSALKAKKSWEQTAFVDRASIFLRAAELVTTKYRHELIAATLFGQGKNIWQAEIDATAERGSDIMWTRMDYWLVEDFVYAISPFNLDIIGGNLILDPVLMGNVVLWKPSPPDIYSSTLMYKILLEVGLPLDIIQLVPGDAEEVNDVDFNQHDFAGLNFFGSSDLFRQLNARFGQGIGNYNCREFTRISCETSGKNFTLLNPTAIV
ncbi:Aldehyde/histidinol dehydrogenase [Dendryphion nanum]|uniref:Aldehyde/histidinol dehydrogenase n=1 Tax=Dendryphion nanum TaxID=256645 RepID=A0A9P9I691_9PLEO|nr:Aldehyde/histidinol dehydrogenase [Dendryphion nanum]